jgi:staphylococcal nuclease domain-containing protein 1
MVWCVDYQYQKFHFTFQVWENFEEPKEVDEVKEEVTERQVNQKAVVVTEVKNDGFFFAQYVESGQQLEKLMNDLRSNFESTPPLPGAYQAKRGDLCAAKFSDGQW